MKQATFNTRLHQLQAELKRIKQGKCAYMLSTYNEFVADLLYVFNNMKGKEMDRILLLDERFETYPREKYKSFGKIVSADDEYVIRFGRNLEGGHCIHLSERWWKKPVYRDLAHGDHAIYEILNRCSWKMCRKLMKFLCESGRMYLYTRINWASFEEVEEDEE